MLDITNYIVAPYYPPALFLDEDNHTLQRTNVRMQ